MASVRIALYQPDIAGNTGTILRMAACLGLAVDIIEPAGFDLSGRALKRAGMDYLQMAALTRHLDFVTFQEWRLREGPKNCVAWGPVFPVNIAQMHRFWVRGAICNCRSLLFKNVQQSQ